MGGGKTNVRIAAVADLHYGTGQEAHKNLFAQVAEHADILLLGGDLTNSGLPEEIRQLTKDLTSSLKIPVVAVLGNHDYESGKQDELKQILADAGAMVLDGTACELHGIGFAGVKGFAGGFGRGALQPWGEEIVKLFVREAVNESLKLETALAKLRTEHRIALLHYSPISATVQGEPLEIYPYLGSSRLEEPLNRYKVTAVFHGHAHGGVLEGVTQANIPVYNVSLPILQRTYPEKLPFYLLEIVAPEKVPAQQPAATSKQGNP